MQPQVMTIAWLLSMADLMNPVIPWSITIQRSNDFTVTVNHMVMSIDAPTHQNIYPFCHLQHFIQLWSWLLHHVSANPNAGIQSFDLSQGSLPPADSGSCEFKMFTLPRGVVTPVSVTQFITSSGPPATMQLDMAIAMAGLSTEQVEEIFLLTHEPKKLGRKIACDFINLSSQEVLFHMGAQATGYEKVASGCPDCVMAYYTIMHSKGEKVENLNEAVEPPVQKGR